MNKPFIAHSEITDEIYVVCGKEKYCVTDQVIRAMTETGRMEQRPHGEWEYLKEHIIELRDADGKATQKETCQVILNLMGVIEKEGEAE